MINIKKDERCFLYCILAGVDPHVPAHPNQASNYAEVNNTFN